MQLLLFEQNPQEMDCNKVNIMLSLHDKYFKKMLAGTKKYEYRFNFPKGEVRAYIYIPKPVKAVKGYVDLERSIEGTAEEISSIYANCGDGSYESMFNYIGNNKIIYAMRIKQVIAFEKPILYSTLKSAFPDFCAPQSYIILDKNPALLSYIKETAL